MFSYQKKLQFPINIKNPDPRAAAIIISQYGGNTEDCIEKRYDNVK